MPSFYLFYAALMAFPFRSQSIGALVEAISSGYTKAATTTLLLKTQADDWDPDRYDNKEHRMQLVFKGLRTAGTPDADKAALELARMTMAKIAPPAVGTRSRFAEWPDLRDALAADGWEFDAESSRLTPIVPEVSVPEELNGLEAELEDRGWSTASLHFRQAAKGFGAGDWESASSQLRSFLEDFLPSVVETITGERPSNPGAAIQVLERDFLIKGEREFLKGLWALCNERGAHSGASSRAEATFRLMTVTATARFILSRLP
jgi:hypothetical protein